jgi:hypothetical protein
LRLTIAMTRSKDALAEKLCRRGANVRILTRGEARCGIDLNQ